MKTLRTLTTALIFMCLIPTATATVLASRSGSHTACAQAEETQYPEAALFTSNLTFESLHDFAIQTTQGSMVFALAGTAETPVTEAEKGNGFYLYENGAYTFHASPSRREIVQVEYSGTALYFADSLGTVYNERDEEVTYTFAQTTKSADAGDYMYRIGDDCLYITNYSQQQPVLTTQSGNYKKLVKANNEVYALKNNALYTLSGTTEEQKELPFVNYERASNISIGNTFTLLKAEQTPQFVNIATGAYVTPIDLESSQTSASGCFVVDKTYQAESEIRMALLLCETGNAWLYATKEGIYLTPKPDTPQYNAATIVVQSAQAYTNAECAIYSVPYATESTRLSSLSVGSSLQITGKIEQQSYSNLTTDWYAVTYTAKDGTTQNGYIPTGLVYGYAFSADDQTYQTQNPEYSENNVVRMAVLIMIVVTLILLLLVYITIVATRKSKGKRSRRPSRLAPGDEEDTTPSEE